MAIVAAIATRWARAAPSGGPAEKRSGPTAESEATYGWDAGRSAFILRMFADHALIANWAKMVMLNLCDL